MFIKVKQGDNVNINIIHQVTRLDAIVIKIGHEWIVFMTIENMTITNIDFQLPIIRPQKKVGQGILYILTLID